MPNRGSKRLLVIAMAIALTMSTMAVALAGSASKATGSGTWTNPGGVEFTAEFNAHEEVEGKNGNVRAAKGDLFQSRTDGGGDFYVDVTTVVVGDGYACFSGATYGATGVYEQFNGQNRWTFVTDGDGPGSGTFRGSWTSIPTECVNGSLDVGSVFTGGNVTIHDGKAHQ